MTRRLDFDFVIQLPPPPIWGIKICYQKEVCGREIQLLAAQKPINRPGWWRGKFALF